MKARRKEVFDCFYLTKDNVGEFVKWCWNYIRLRDFPSGNDFKYNIVKNDGYFYIDWVTCKTKRYFSYDRYYVIYAADHEFEDVRPYTKKEFEEEFEVIE